MEADTYVVSTSPNAGSTTTGTAILSAPLRDTLSSSSELSFTRAFTTSAALSPIGQTYLVPSSSFTCPLAAGAATGACPGDTLQYSGPCFATGTRVVSTPAMPPAGAPANAIYIDKLLLCTLPAATNIAAGPGFPQLRIESSRFENLGQSLTTAEQTTFKVAITKAINPGVVGSTFFETFYCGASGSLDANCSNAYALIPGQTPNPIASPPSPAVANPIPPADQVVSGPAAGDVMHTGGMAGTVKVTFINSSPTAANFTVHNGDIITFNTGFHSGKGYAVYIANTPWFANTEDRITDSDFERAYSSPLFIAGSSNLLLAHDTIKEDKAEYQGLKTGSSACMVLLSSVGVRLIDDVCMGATGGGIHLGHPINAQVLGGLYAHNSYSGIFACGARGLTVGGGARFLDNGEWPIFPLIQSSTQDNGLTVNPSCTTGMPGAESGIQVDDASFIDDRAPTTTPPYCPFSTNPNGYFDVNTGPTQLYGIGAWQSTSGATPVLMGYGVTFAGNSCAPIDPNVHTTYQNYPQ